MKHKILYITVIVTLAYQSTTAQNNYGVKGFEPKSFTVTDSTPVTYNGLQAGYTIKDESEKSVGKKGDFSRYKIYFYLTNIGTEAKIMYRNLSFLGHAGPITNSMALFKCNNATGARFTNKMATMELLPCKIEGLVTTKDCNTGKETQSKDLVDIGFWIRPGETVSKTYPMIVPLGEKPNVTITFNPEVANQTGTFINIENNNQQQQQQQEFSIVHIKNFATNNYLHIQNGPLACSTINMDWWSAQWEIIPVSGGNNFQIRNRWKNTYLSSNNSLLSEDIQSTATLWLVQETTTANTFYIKTVADNSRLYIDNGMLRLSSSFINNEAASKWILEK